MEVPKELRYSQEHEWVLVEEENMATIGITITPRTSLGMSCLLSYPSRIPN